MEMYRNRSRQPSEPAGNVPGDSYLLKHHCLRWLELLAAVKTSLRAKVASLEEDNWMFEAEKEEAG